MKISFSQTNKTLSNGLGNIGIQDFCMPRDTVPALECQKSLSTSTLWSGPPLQCSGPSPADLMRFDYPTPYHIQLANYSLEYTAPYSRTVFASVQIAFRYIFLSGTPDLFSDNGSDICGDKLLVLCTQARKG